MRENVPKMVIATQSVASWGGEVHEAGSVMGFPAFTVKELTFAKAHRYLEQGKVRYEIIIGRLFGLLSETAQRVVLYHERGHVEQWVTNRSYGELESEFAADYYASLHTSKGEVIAALRETLTLVCGKDLSAEQELRARLAAIC